MPWDGCEIYIAGVRVVGNQSSFEIYLTTPAVLLGGKPAEISAVQPTWLNKSTLVFNSDITGFQNPQIVSIGGGGNELTVHVKPLLSRPESMDFSDPSWWLGGSNIAVLDKTHVLFSASKDGRHFLRLVNVTGVVQDIDCPYVVITRMRALSRRTVTFLGAKVDEGKALVVCSFDEQYHPSYSIIVPNEQKTKKAGFKDFFSLPHPMTLITERASERSSVPVPVHILFYSPKNNNYIGPADEKPCAIVNVHGGPTFVESQALNIQKQFFTSRGWAWIDVNYAGSSSYGRKYMDTLKGYWGETDVEDCIHVVEQLSSHKYALIDRARVVIRGGSAGGYTTLNALCRQDGTSPTFAGGCSLYGISDLRRLIETTHKFQSWYAKTLIGGGPEQIPEVYHDRSPIFHAKNIKVPLLILQGNIDPIVPPDQAEKIVDAIHQQGGDVSSKIFENEGHGWRTADTIGEALQMELTFYQRILKLT